MDEAQKIIVKALVENRDCLKDAKMLKNVLADAIPNDKMHANLVMEAYNEGVFKCFFEKDPTLSLLQFIPTLVNDYCISDENAVWSVVTWCYVFGKSETAKALLSLNLAQKPCVSSNSAQGVSQNQIRELGIGVYRCGTDIDPGENAIMATWKKIRSYNGSEYLWYTVGSDPENLERGDNEFRDKCYIRIKEGQYLKLDTGAPGWMVDVESITAKKVSD